MKKRGLDLKLSLMIVIFTGVLSIILTVASMVEHSNKVDEYYGENASKLALSFANMTDGDFIRELRELVDEPEFQAIREKALETNDWTPMENLLEERGLLEEYNEETDMLKSFKKDMDVEYLYIHSIEGDISVYLMSATEGMSALGLIGANAEEFAEYTTNMHIDPTVSDMDGIWVCSAYEPIYDSNNEAVSTVGVDIDMNQVMADRNHFRNRMAIYCLIFVLMAALCGIYVIRKLVVKPIESLTDGAKDFTDEESGYCSESVLNLDIHSHDEIETLYTEMRTMQEKILDYLDNITKITAEKEKISAELNVATEIQASMLPRIFPAFPNRDEIKLFASMAPALEVGGDFYDYFFIDYYHLALVIADVSGKGVPAALFMAISKTLIKDRAQDCLDPATILSNTNNHLAEANDANLFVTVWLGILDLRNGELKYSDAGHEYPILARQNGEIELVKPINKKMPVAAIEGVQYVTNTMQLNVGDTIFLYTDGVPEATNASDELYGMERLEEFMKTHYSLDVEELLPAVRKNVDEFVGDAPQFDDLTMLALRIVSFAEEKGEKTDGE